MRCKGQIPRHYPVGVADTKAVRIETEKICIPVPTIFKPHNSIGAEVIIVITHTYISALCNKRLCIIIVTTYLASFAQDISPKCLCLCALRKRSKNGLWALIVRWGRTKLCHCGRVVDPPLHFFVRSLRHVFLSVIIPFSAGKMFAVE